ncbi:hypothetical protein FH008_04460 [Listeria monocytogenes]|nr:hypothetical protein [Listeria monocytogenes]EBF5115033.1 hypothetical protein [Listeria monocytogenes]EBF5125132.1 hypothetical protein [Listeria monocytogenes]EBF5150425.1 hypothetical protein [Listeria monocytogenes]
MKKGFIKGIILVIVISLFVSAFPLEGLASYRTITSEKAVGYSGKVVRSTDGIYDLGPHNTEGVTRVAMSSEYINQTIQVTEEVITDNKVTWVLISTWDGKEIGYMDKAGIEQGANFREVTNEKEVNYQAKVVRTTDGIYDFGPQNTPGVKRIGTSSQYENQSFIVSEEVVTDNEVTWVVLRDFDGHEIGWMNKNGIEKSFDYREITSESDVNYKVEITRLGDGIISKGPHHTPGADRVAFSDEYINKKFNVTNEMVTDNKVTWLLLVDDTGKQLGWIDKAGTSQISENKVVFSSNETTLPEFQTVEEIQSMDLTGLPEELILEELPEKKEQSLLKSATIGYEKWIKMSSTRKLTNGFIGWHPSFQNYDYNISYYHLSAARITGISVSLGYGPISFSVPVGANSGGKIIKSNPKKWSRPAVYGTVTRIKWKVKKYTSMNQYLKTEIKYTNQPSSCYTKTLYKK